MQLPSCNTLKFFLHALGSVEIGYQSGDRLQGLRQWEIIKLSTQKVVVGAYKSGRLREIYSMTTGGLTRKILVF